MVCPSSCLYELKKKKNTQKLNAFCGVWIARSACGWDSSTVMVQAEVCVEVCVQLLFPQPFLILNASK